MEDLAPQLIPVDGEAPHKEPKSGGRVLHEAAIKSRVATSEPESDDTKTLLNCLKDADKLHVDSLIEGSRLSAQTVLNLMLELELKGIVVQHPGKLFALAEPSASRRL